MAKATAICTCKVCGRTFEHDVFGANRRDAGSKAEWAAGYFDECPDCYHARVQRKREEANAAAAKEAEVAGLPELTGSEKQVAWAVTIRQKAFDGIMEAVEELESKGKGTGTGKIPVNGEMVAVEFTAREFVRWLVTTRIRASWWIDNRRMMCDNGAVTLDNFIQGSKSDWAEYLKNRPVAETPAETEARKAAEEEMTVAPENQTHDGAVEIIVTETSVSARYEKNDDFGALVKGLGYRWDADRRVWEKSINITTGTAQERASELGNHLLNAGFAVRIADPETREKAVTGDYTPEHHRWIAAYTSGDYKGWLCVRLPHGEDMYKKAKALPKARYCKPNIAVPASEYAAVEDFAECYDYRITPAAREAIDAAKASVMVVVPAPVKVPVYDEHRPEDLLADAGADVLADLMEDE